MLKPKYISDVRMLDVMEYWMTATGKTQTEFCEKIGFLQGNIPNVRKGRQSFQVPHIIAAMKLINGNFNYIFGAESNMFLSEKKNLTPLQQIKQAVKALENERRNRGIS